MPAIDFFVGQVSPVSVKTSVQVEVDLGYEGRNDIVLIEAKVGHPERLGALDQHALPTTGLTGNESGGL